MICAPCLIGISMRWDGIKTKETLPGTGLINPLVESRVSGVCMLRGSLPDLRGRGWSLSSPATRLRTRDAMRCGVH